MVGWYDRFLNRLWDFLTRVAKSAYWRIMLRFFPALKMTDDDDERFAILYSAATTLNYATPKWKRYLTIAIQVFIAPLVGGYCGWYIASMTKLPLNYQPAVGLACGVITMFACGLLVMWNHSARIRRSHYTLLHFSGHIVCPECGYDLRGHVDEGSNCTCPECGHDLKEPARTN